jgi:hypothetical protein
MNKSINSHLKAWIVAMAAMTLLNCGGEEQEGRYSHDEPEKLHKTPVFKTDKKGSDKTKSPKVTEVPDGLTTLPEPADESRIFSQQELMYLAGSTASTSQSAYSHCKDILAQGIYNRNHMKLSESAKFALKKEYCAMDEGEFSKKIYDYKKSAHSSGSSNGDTRSGSLSYLSELGISASVSRSGSSNASDEEIRHQAGEEAKSWKTKNCGSSSVASSNSFIHTVLSEQIDPHVVGAWRSCVAKQNNGFFCSSREVEDVVSVRVQWIPNDVQKILLPKVKLSVTTEHNLKLVSKEIPQSLGTGSGKTISYQKVDQDKHSIFEITAEDDLGQVTFVCSLDVPKVIKGQVMEAASCGIDSYRFSRGDVCGVLNYKKGSAPVCGVDGYKKKRSKVCGVELYKKRASLSCPGSKAERKKTIVTSGSCTSRAPKPRACPTGYQSTSLKRTSKTCRVPIPPFLYSVAKKQVRHCKFNEIKKSCRKKDFGVERYNSCTHKNHGVKSYKTCGHSSFGVESYKKCSHPSFGVAKYKSCFVLD